MRTEADILVLDEPTSAMDAEAETRLFEQFRAATQNQMAILISHRFSTVRRADNIIVLAHCGKLIEQGSHEDLVDYCATIGWPLRSPIHHAGGKKGL
jgi:ABC-type bacteriocin/lantibiotic exporter with double-glycine peptidase domain